MNINVSSVFGTSLFLKISDHIRQPMVFPAETLSQGSSQLDATATFHSSASITMFLLPFQIVESPRGIPCSQVLCSAAATSIFRPEAYFQNPHWFSFSIDSWLPHIRWHCGRRGCRRFAAVCNKVGARGGGSAVWGSVPIPR
jgi:hypothetical protein